MRTALSVAGTLVILFFAGYGVFTMVAGPPGAGRGKDAGELAGTFTASAMLSAREMVKKDLESTPDAELEKNAEFWTRKAYPVTKGILKGQIKAYLDDKDRDEMPQIMYEAGKVFATQVVQPFAQGVADGSPKAIESIDKTVRGAKELGADAGKVLDAVTQGVKQFRKGVEEFRGHGPARQ
jgi:hypothetical protein